MLIHVVFVEIAELLLLERSFYPRVSDAPFIQFKSYSTLVNHNRVAQK